MTSRVGLKVQPVKGQGTKKWIFLVTALWHYFLSITRTLGRTYYIDLTIKIDFIGYISPSVHWFREFKISQETFTIAWIS